VEKGKLEILEADIERQMEIIDSIYEKIQKRGIDYQDNVERMESLAYQLHNLYCAFEDLMRMISIEFENQISESADWHARLLNRMTEDIKSIRPALFSRKNLPFLDELRAFRHWFRHAYSHEVEQDKLGIVLKKAFKLRDTFKDDIQQFIQKLHEKELKL
jgi:hypothetical protein